MRVCDPKGKVLFEGDRMQLITLVKWLWAALRGDRHQGWLLKTRESSPAVHRIAQWFSEMGWTVTIPARKEAPQRNQWEQYIDHGDLTVERLKPAPALPERLRIEIKHLGTQFVSSWPYDRLYVDAVDTYDRKAAPPHHYLIVSRDMRYAVGIDVEATRRYWGKYEDKANEEGGRATKDYYTCPIDMARFFDLEAPVGYDAESVAWLDKNEKSLLLNGQ